MEVITSRNTTTRFTTIEVKVGRLFRSLNKSLTRTDRKFVYSRNSSLNARIDCDRFAFRSLVFHVFHRFVFLSTFLRSLPSSLSLSILYPPLIRWRVSDISWHSPIYSLFLFRSFLHADLPSCPTFERAFVELSMERFRALPRLSGASSLSFIFPSCSGFR